MEFDDGLQYFSIPSRTTTFWFGALSVDVYDESMPIRSLTNSSRLQYGYATIDVYLCIVQPSYVGSQHLTIILKNNIRVSCLDSCFVSVCVCLKFTGVKDIRVFYPLALFLTDSEKLACRDESP